MDPFIGEIKMFGGNFAPRGWAFCEGQILPIAQNQALFSILGTIYGGDGRVSFALPDLRGRVSMHPGQGPGLSDYRLGQNGGAEINILNVAQMPSHNHIATGTIKASTADGTTNDPAGNVLAAGKTAVERATFVDSNIYTAAANTAMASNAVSVTVGNNGGNQPINNMSPYLTVNYIIALEGVFPSRS
ncbi:phage tail protein [Flavobacterium faecale]|uniref:phage tail protein n=1 Tax=Flavobacterium faecale TaxID=1355330 RepID=UPI003AAF8226